MKLYSQLRITSVLLISLLLSSCVVAVVAGAAAGMVYDKRSVATMEADAKLFHLVHTQITRAPQLKASRILVTSFNRVVLLVGQVPNVISRELALKKAQAVPGVKRVYNEITVGPQLTLKEATEDSWITSQVRSNMLTKKGLESGSIRIVTENKAVYLMGIVSMKQASLAVDVARRVKGVKKVVKIFSYIP